MKKDIRCRDDIERLVNTFYEKVMKDELLGPVFKERANVNWATHLRAMYRFWENIILYTGTYEGNPMQLHLHLHHITALNDTHFDRWNFLFIATVNELFEGEKASSTLRRATRISLILRQNILAGQDIDK